MSNKKRTLPIHLYPARALAGKCDPVLEINEPLRDFIEDLTQTMYESDGIGLAAPQVGVMCQVIVADVEGLPDRKSLMQIVNPAITEVSGKQFIKEGCLSLPGVNVMTRRHNKIRVLGYDPHGNEIDIEAKGLLSVCLQHEIDHIRGFTMLNRITPTKRRLVENKYFKEYQRALNQSLENEMNKSTEEEE